MERMARHVEQPLAVDYKSLQGWNRLNRLNNMTKLQSILIKCSIGYVNVYFLCEV